MPAKIMRTMLRRMFSNKAQLKMLAISCSTIALASLYQRGASFEIARDLSHYQEYINEKQAQIKRLLKEDGKLLSEIKLTHSGDVYGLEFLIDQRKIDVFTVLVDFIMQLKEPEFRISKGTNSFKYERIRTFSVDFVEHVNGKVEEGRMTVSGEFTNERPSFKFRIEKSKTLTFELLNVLLKVYEEASKSTNFFDRSDVIKAMNDKSAVNSNIRNQESNNKFQQSIERLKKLGVQVILPEDKGKFSGLSWDQLGGYDRQKREIEDTILLGLTHREVYDQITMVTRQNFESSRPKAVLFEGPPGTGKTTSAKIIASIVKIPLVYVPSEAVLSKWFGESERNFSDIFEAASGLGKSIIFIDEIDAIAVNRDRESLHEVSQRLVSTLLRKLDSFESDSDVLLIAATNRKHNLDPAILSRIDISITFELPDASSRKEILKRYAKQLTEDQLDKLASQAINFSGRTILEVCKDVERKWASMMVRGDVSKSSPDFEIYKNTINNRINSGLI